MCGMCVHIMGMCGIVEGMVCGVGVEGTYRAGVGCMVGMSGVVCVGAVSVCIEVGYEGWDARSFPLKEA